MIWEARLCVVTFFVATFRASGETSPAIIVIEGRVFARAIDMLPEPVPISIALVVAGWAWV